jgi:hypothetical protein
VLCSARSMHIGEGDGIINVFAKRITMLPPTHPA